MIRKIEKLVLAVILGLIPPVIGLLMFWWSTYSFLPERYIPFLALTGLLLGILVDIFFLKRWVGKAYRFDSKLWMAVYIFYSMCVFGFFMGVPVFNVALAIPAGFIVGGKLAAEGADSLQVWKAAKRTALFTTVVLVFVCLASAFIALASSSTGNDLKGMLGLNFEITQKMIIGLIVVGSAVLLAVGWGLAVAAVRLSYRFLHRAYAKPKVVIITTGVEK